MSYSDVIEIVVPVVSLVIAMIALFQTKRQIVLSNKQQLFEKRLRAYTKFITVYDLYSLAKSYLTEEMLIHANERIFSMLTNCSELEQMYHVMDTPLNQKEKQILLIKCEELKIYAIEVSTLFDERIAKTAYEFILYYTTLLKQVYQLQIFIHFQREENSTTQSPLPLEVYDSKCKKQIEDIGLIATRDKLEQLAVELIGNKIIEKMKKELCLVKTRNRTFL